MSVLSKPFIWLQHALPHHGLSRFAGRFAASENPWIKDLLIRRFILAYNVDMGEAERPERDYRSFNDFFTRTLKAGARPIADASRHVVSPADGAISQLGRITGGRIVQAKGRDYSVRELLGGDADLARRFEGGHFATIYLSPRDYHRVHMPVSGTLAATIYVPGQLFSVNAATAQGVEGLFARNERLACIFDTGIGTVASVMVGAMIVAGIETAWSGPVEPHGKALIRSVLAEAEGDEAPSYEAGDEMGKFLLGSTVVLLFEEGRIEWLADFRAGDKVRMGQAIARRLDAE
ncbi:archaetidylserine decarboxylase [Pseudopontixanthobacter vadosimaris]|uniref:archaetidylserine decarboxylase n=1 Tax=Pseudopontixanthobacter vadosimaris TaxID=2726450 RepID=UPI001F0F1739|nr:archaetidylserine decarboxylase [Pseudopontixanthobacter vadosimaris]